MKFLKYNAWLLSSCLFLLALNSCSSGAGTGSDSGSSSEVVNSEVLSGFSSRCGVVEDGESISVPSDAEIVGVEVVDSDSVIIIKQEGRQAGEKQVVKFHGLSSSGVNDFRKLHGMDVLKRKVVGGAYFVPAGKDCDVVLSGGAQGILGQLYSLDGENINEFILAQGAAMPSSDICGGAVLSRCYGNIPLATRPPSDVELNLQDVSLSSQCGGVYKGVLRNPLTKAELVKIQALSGSEVIVTRQLGLESGNPQIVKLHGLYIEGLSNTAKNLGLNYLKAKESEELYLVVESQECEIQTSQGGLGVVGQLYTKAGVSINEELLKLGYAVESFDSCGGSLISTCYQQIATAAPDIQDPVVELPSEENESSGGGGGNLGGLDENLIRNFLWKPVSDSNGNLAVLVNPIGVRIEVSGLFNETLVDKGPSNGRGTTSRGKRPGCDFGNNVTVSFFNSAGEAIPVAGGGTTVTVEDGCERFEFRR